MSLTGFVSRPIMRLQAQFPSVPIEGSEIVEVDVEGWKDDKQQSDVKKTLLKLRDFIDFPEINFCCASKKGVFSGGPQQEVGFLRAE